MTDKNIQIEFNKLVLGYYAGIAEAMADFNRAIEEWKDAPSQENTGDRAINALVVALTTAEWLTGISKGFIESMDNFDGRCRKQFESEQGDGK